MLKLYDDDNKANFKNKLFLKIKMSSYLFKNKFFLKNQNVFLFNLFNCVYKFCAFFPLVKLFAIISPYRYYENNLKRIFSNWFSCFSLVFICNDVLRLSLIHCNYMTKSNMSATNNKFIDIVLIENLVTCI